MVGSSKILPEVPPRPRARPVGTFLGVDVTVTANDEAMGGWLHFDGRNRGDLGGFGAPIREPFGQIMVESLGICGGFHSHGGTPSHHL